jgi:hypothetical protein
MISESCAHYHSLKRSSAQVQTAVELTHGKLRAIEDELADFLDDYYAKVGPSFEQLTRLQEELLALQSGSFGMKPKSSDVPSISETQPTAIKQFYRDMARECHPDSAGANAGQGDLKAEMMKTLNAAYARKNLSEMWHIKWELERQKEDGKLSHQKRLELLKTQQEHMQNTLSELQARERELRDSEAYALMQHARLMQCCGQDFIAMVQGRVAGQLEDAKRELRAAKHQAKYWGHVKVQRAGN